MTISRILLCAALVAAPSVAHAEAGARNPEPAPAAETTPATAEGEGEGVPAPEEVASPFEEGDEEGAAEAAIEAQPEASAEAVEPPPATESPEAETPPAEMPPQPPLAVPAVRQVSEMELRAPVPVDPRQWHVRVGAGATEMFVRHPSLDPLKGDDHLVFGGITVGAEWVLFDVAPITLQLGYAGTDFDDSLFGGIDTDVHLHTMQAGVQAGYRLWDALTPYVRVGFAGTWGEVQIDGQSEDVGGWEFAPGVYAMAGAELTVPRAWMRRAFRTDVFTLGVSVEGGYHYLGALEYGPRTEESLLDHEESPLGTLTLHGGAMNIGAVLSF